MRLSTSPTQTIATTATIDSVPGPLCAVIDLFATELRGVAFPGVDATTLAQHADEVRARACEVERAHAVLDAALAALGDRTAALSALASRALAYARIYAADDPVLAERLEEIHLGERVSAIDAGARPPLRRRRRGSERPELPLGQLAATEPADGPADE